MAYGAKTARARSLARMVYIYIWPSDALIAQSWNWPASWHEAFELATDYLGLAVAFSVANGLRTGEGEATLRLSIGCIKFSVARRGASFHITISEFAPEGPDAPRQDHQQPHAADGLILALRGSRRSRHTVVFHGRSRIFPSRICYRLQLRAMRGKDRTGATPPMFRNLASLQVFIAQCFMYKRHISSNSQVDLLKTPEAPISEGVARYCTVVDDAASNHSSERLMSGVPGPCVPRREEPTMPDLLGCLSIGSGNIWPWGKTNPRGKSIQIEKSPQDDPPSRRLH